MFYNVHAILIILPMLKELQYNYLRLSKITPGTNSISGLEVGPDGLLIYLG